jgi:hypothetical protein
LQTSQRAHRLLDRARGEAAAAHPQLVSLQWRQLATTVAGVLDEAQNGAHNKTAAIIAARISSSSQAV